MLNLGQARRLRTQAVATALRSVTSDRCAILDLAVFERAKVAELADAPDLGSGTERCGGSSPPFRTTMQEAGRGRQTAAGRKSRFRVQALAWVFRVSTASGSDRILTSRRWRSGFV